MQTNIVFALVISIVYLLTVFIMNKYLTDKKSPKQMVIDSCVVFLSVLATSFGINFLGFSGQKGGSVTAAFTTKPEF